MRFTSAMRPITPTMMNFLKARMPSQRDLEESHLCGDAEVVRVPRMRRLMEDGREKKGEMPADAGFEVEIQSRWLMCGASRAVSAFSARGKREARDR
jgi:hypothetical protein